MYFTFTFSRNLSPVGKMGFIKFLNTHDLSYKIPMSFFHLNSSREITKRCIVLSGIHVPLPSEDENVLQVFQDEIRNKWGLEITSTSIAQAHRVGKEGRKIMAEFVYRCCSK